MGLRFLGSSGGGRSVLSRLGPPTQGNTLLLPTVISRNILTHKDMTESLGTTAVEPGLEGPPRAKGVHGSTRNLLEKRGGKPGPSGHVRAVLRADEM